MPNAINSRKIRLSITKIEYSCFAFAIWQQQISRIFIYYVYIFNIT